MLFGDTAYEHERSAYLIFLLDWCLVPALST